MTPDPTSQEALRELVAQTIDRMDQDGDAALEAACQAHPELAQALRRRIATLRDLGVLAAPEGVARTPERLGEFRLVKELGAGGMGIVYQAVQEPLGREVALKVVRPEHLYFPAARERFLREIDIIARLQHPGIVPIHTVGEDHGVPYFAMDLVRGRTLAAALDALQGRELARLAGADLAPDPAQPGYLYAGTWEAACLRVVRQVAEALAHAHDRGVVHRDVKPSNILLTADGSGRAMLFDFGLAAVAGAGRLTRTGTPLGTVRYMAPEQTRGELDRIGPPTDVYGLGVTLYEMLTLQPAFAGRSDPEVLLAVQRGEPRPVRERNPRISWEAETVCRTAMDVDPQRRYARAADFARDLQNVLEGRPIEARRASLALRVRRFVQHHPARATALGLSTVLLLGGPLTYAWQEHRSARAITAQRDRAERNYQRAIAAVDQLLSRVGALDLRLVPQMEPVRRALLEDALQVLGEFVAEDAGDPLAWREMATAHLRLGTLCNDLGRSQDAVQQQQRGLAALANLARTTAWTPKDQETLARLRVDLARSLGMAGQAAPARAEHERAHAAIAALLQAAPGQTRLLELQAANQRALGVLLRSMGELALARTTLQVAAEQALQACDQGAGGISLLEEAARCWGEHSLNLLQSFRNRAQDLAPTQAALDRTVELCRRLVQQSPGEPGHRYSLATAQNNLAGLWRRLDEFERARALYGEARTTLEQLVRDYPATLLFQLELATVHNQIGLSYDLEQRNQDAEPDYARTVTLLRELARRVPDEPAYARRLAMALMNHSVCAKNRGDLAGAEAELVQAQEMGRKAVSLAPAAADVRQELVEILSATAYVRRLAGDYLRALEASEEIAQIATNWRGLRVAAFGYCEAGLMARKDPDLTPEERSARFDQYRQRAIALLRQGMARATDTDRPNPRELREGKSFAPLRGLPDYEALCRELK